MRYNPHVSVDCVVFGFDELSLKVLLVDRNYGQTNGTKHAPDTLKLPGSLVYDDENIDTAANRVLKELTGLENIYLKQFHVFGSPDRLNKPSDLQWLQEQTQLPINRVVTIAYLALVRLDAIHYDQRAQWCSVDTVPELAFDHNNIVAVGLNTLRKELDHEPIVFELLPVEFTLRQFQTLHEIILGHALDSRNFRKKIAKTGYLVPLAKKEHNVSHKPAQFFKFNMKKFLHSKLSGE